MKELCIQSSQRYTDRDHKVLDIRDDKLSKYYSSVVCRQLSSVVVC